MKSSFKFFQLEDFGSDMLELAHLCFYSFGSISCLPCVGMREESRGKGGAQTGLVTSYLSFSSALISKGCSSKQIPNSFLHIRTLIQHQLPYLLGYSRNNYVCVRMYQEMADGWRNGMAQAVISMITINPSKGRLPQLLYRFPVKRKDLQAVITASGSAGNSPIV
ncbi:hypothetical protein KIL84_000239 [Mauremys mutica]|uniref:Uncharacterized protein n=1 Tax=Mauremys mutica TaxID=74926 RepID=A0A9D3XFH0_9SAUR|nr:hypothetical protein KIL84_000239 [Mauremys mutica]